MRFRSDRWIFLVTALWASHASAQLSKWLVRDLNGVYALDLSTPSPTIGPFIPGLGTGGTEDVNMMTDAANNILFSTAVDNMNMISVFDGSMNQMPNGFGLFGHTSTLQSAICPIPVILISISSSIWSLERATSIIRSST